ncbi:NS4 protein [Yunnan orbivirus]|uniref:NS4 protein n=1 Tax=Yunnan orbivirus TaxID=306276 RepID=UPI000269ADAB|nr:NS4 protein [Yunnan orbivirus]
MERTTPRCLNSERMEAHLRVIRNETQNRRLRDLELVKMAAMRGYLAPEVVPFPYNQLNQFHILEITPLTERKPLHLCPHCWESQKQKHKYEKRWKERERTPERVESVKKRLNL